VEIRLAETIRAPIEKVFALANDIDRAEEWLPAGVKIEKLTEGPTRAGSRYRETRRVLGRLDTEIYEGTDYDPPHGSEVVADGTKGTAGRGLFRFRIDLAPTGLHDMRVELTGTVTGMGCLGVIAYPIVRSVLRGHSVADLAGLKAWIERQP